MKTLLKVPTTVIVLLGLAWGPIFHTFNSLSSDSDTSVVGLSFRNSALECGQLWPQLNYGIKSAMPLGIILSWIPTLLAPPFYECSWLRIEADKSGFMAWINLH